MKLILTIIYLIGTLNLIAQKELTTDHWKEDIAFLAEQMPLHHINLFKKINDEEFKLKIEQAMNRIDDSFNKNKGIVETAKIVSSIKDGHSFVDGYYPILQYSFKTFPFRVYEFKGGIYIQAVHESFQQYLGAKIIGINGIDVNECKKIVSEMFPIENEMGKKMLAVYGLTSPEVLEAFDLIDINKPITYEFELDGNRTFFFLSSSNTYEQPIESFGVVNDKDWVCANMMTDNQLPLSLKNQNKMYWSEYVPDQKLLYVKFNLVNSSEEQDLLSFFDDVLSQASSLSVDKFILDIRQNIGGETKFIKPIVKKLSTSKVINRKDVFYVLIGRRTFSSAQLISYGLERKSKAFFVGEPTSINSHFFANSRKNIELPNSHLKISLSTREWKGTKEFKKCQNPDILIEETFENYKSNIDSVLDWVISN